MPASPEIRDDCGHREPRGERACALAEESYSTPGRTRYADLPPDRLTRCMGLGSTTFLILAVLALGFVTWRIVPAAAESSRPLLLEFKPPAAPPEPDMQVPEGPRQVEQKAQAQPESSEAPPPLEPESNPSVPSSPARPPAEPASVAEAVPETTAPRSLPAPPAERAANDAKVTWEALLLSHMERYRRYPATARSRGEQGIAYVQFTMNREGRVLSARIGRSSGSALLDGAALATIRRAQPLPAIPADRPDPQRLTVPVEFFTQ
ncbi:protein TonB [Novosphingobium sp. ST904]|nr:protein TonB [Novosphingobium sp. ST904]